MSDDSPSHLYGLVDMGSNGIRFSITDLAPPTARSLPVVFQERLGISLDDVQFPTSTRQPIPQNVIDTVISGLKRFKTVCEDFRVPVDSIKILATDATRNAINSDDYRQQIKDATGWTVDLLCKGDEGRLGACGVASSFDMVDGLVMDLGGGSTQLSWMIFKDGNLTHPQENSVSLPYGAAALTRLLSNIDADGNPQLGRANLKAKIVKEYVDALESLRLPSTLQEKAKNGRLGLYLSGGGFRGWGYILMSKAKRGPYPVPIINGYHASVKDFSETEEVKAAAQEGPRIFRLSKRRASQVPAVAFLISAIMEAFPFIEDVRFCQGGVRAGWLFDRLAPEVKSLSPLCSATSRFAIDPDSAAHISELISAALPANGAAIHRWYPSTLTPSVIRAVADTMYVQSNAPKESASLSALHLPITGVLAAAHGLSHADRALLALILCHRWDGELPPPHDDFKSRLQHLLTSQEVWWSQYLGTVTRFVGEIYPSGRVPILKSAQRVHIESEWADGLGKKGNQQGVVLRVNVVKGSSMDEQGVRGHIASIEEMGKKKKRVGGREYGFGLPIRVDFEWV